MPETGGSGVARARGCESETGRLRKAVVCPPTFFEIVAPTNAMQEYYWSNGHPRPNPQLMAEQHQMLVKVLRDSGVDVYSLKPDPHLPYQHATRDVGTVIGDRLVLSSMMEPSRRGETEVARQVLKRYGLTVLEPDGHVEGGDILVHGTTLYVGIGKRTDLEGAEYLCRTFKHDLDIAVLPFKQIYTHLDTVFGVAGPDLALVYEEAFNPPELERIRAAFPRVILLDEAEQKTGGANVLSLDPELVVSIAENVSVNERLRQAGLEVVTVSYSEVIKSGGSVRCDTLPVERGR
jgi:N-dimethylarginine dimethylaminohydrolase